MQLDKKAEATVVAGDLHKILNATPLKPFDDAVLDFFNALSKRLVGIREYSDVATFGFWCRKASLLKAKEYYSNLDLSSMLGRGIVFHSTPSNVPVNFAYSFAAGLLAGNANIIRLPGKDFEQVQIITTAVRELLDGEHSHLASYVCFVKYPPDKKLHDVYSSICDVRVIWGGDSTIAELRESPLKPKATELTFADRYSIAVIDAFAYLEAVEKQRITQDFYNDTYFSDQNACTSPRIVFWLGNEADRDSAKELFWENTGVMVREKYDLAPVQAVGKLAAFYKVAADRTVSVTGDGALSQDGVTRHRPLSQNYITRIKVTDADSDLMRYKYNSGFFFEQDIDSLSDIFPVCGEGLQTLVYFGIDKDDISSFISGFKPKGIDRVVPIGKSMDFSLIWDGYDLIREMSRKVVLL